jgi:hypothetical protein
MPMNVKPIATLDERINDIRGPHRRDREHPHPPERVEAVEQPPLAVYEEAAARRRGRCVRTSSRR